VNKISDAVLKQLRDIVGADNLLVPGDDLEPYTHDEVAEISAMPEAVAKPGSTDEVVKIMKLASKELFPVTPRGAGQGLSGGAVAIQGGLVLSIERMDKILEIDEENHVATVEPGAITGNIHRAVEELQLFYPPDPASCDSCTIGGNIAENSGGVHCLKYGLTIHNLLEITFVTIDGDVITVGSHCYDNPGYDWIALLTGSEGMLGSDYPGFYPAGDTRALRKLLHRVETDDAFLSALRRAIRHLSALVAPERERGAWKRLLSELI